MSVTGHTQHRNGYVVTSLAAEREPGEGFSHQ
jgi:hypothetical protein